MESGEGIGQLVRRGVFEYIILREREIDIFNIYRGIVR